MTGRIVAPPEWDLLLSAAQKNRPEQIREMVQSGGVDPSHTNGVGQSALHIAALWGHGASLLSIEDRATCCVCLSIVVSIVTFVCARVCVL
jgi:ankyrin repeat protein